MDFFSDFVDSLHGSDFMGEDSEELFEVITQFSTDYDCLTQGQLLRLLALVRFPSPFLLCVFVCLFFFVFVCWIVFIIFYIVFYFFGFYFILNTINREKEDMH
jgi:hypothetical protein